MSATYEQTCRDIAASDRLVVAAMNVWPATLHVRGVGKLAPYLSAMATSVGDGAWEGECIPGVDVDCDAPREAAARPWRIEDDEVQP